MNDADPKVASASPLELALGVQIRSLADKPLDARMLLELEKTCRLARELLVIGKQTGASGYGPSSYQAPYLTGIGTDLEGGGMMMNGTGVPNPTETFGAQLIREAIPLLAGLIKKPAGSDEKEEDTFTDITTALERARADGDLYATALLQHQLEKMVAGPDGQLPASLLSMKALSGESPS
jgi:hypothetical protein